MISDKVEFCKKYDIEISEEEWPCKHLPDIIIADRGELLKGQKKKYSKKQVIVVS